MRKSVPRRIATAFILLSLTSVAAWAPDQSQAVSVPAYQLTPLPALSPLGSSFQPVALANDGTILGYTQRQIATAGNEAFLTHIYLLPPGGNLHELAQPSGISDLMPMGMNNHGEIIAYDSSDSSGYTGYVYRAGVWHSLAPGADDPTAISDAGQITGFGEANNGSYAFLVDDRGGASRVLGALPCGCATNGWAIGPTGAVFGSADDRFGNPHAVVFPANGGPASDLQGALPGVLSSEERAVNAHGIVAGVLSMNVMSGDDHVTRYDTTLHDLGGIPSWPHLAVTGIDTSGRIVGTASRTEHAATVNRAFVADAGGPHDLTTLAGLGTTAVIRTAVAVNAGGDILAQADLGHGLMTVLLTPRPGSASAFLPGGTSGFPPVPVPAGALTVQTSQGETTYTCPFFGYVLTVSPTEWENYASSDFLAGGAFCDPQAQINYVSAPFSTGGNINSEFYVLVFRHTASAADALSLALHHVFSAADWPLLHLVGGAALGSASPPISTLRTAHATWTITSLNMMFSVAYEQPLDARQIMAVTRAADGYTWVIQGKAPLSLLSKQMPWLQAVITSFRPLPGSPYETAATPPSNVRLL